jgi:hypothetical protein
MLMLCAKRGVRGVGENCHRKGGFLRPEDFWWRGEFVWMLLFVTLSRVCGKLGVTVRGEKSQKDRIIMQRAWSMSQSAPTSPISDVTAIHRDSISVICLMKDKSSWDQCFMCYGSAREKEVEASSGSRWRGGKGS